MFWGRALNIIMFGLLFAGRILNIHMFICTFSGPWQLDILFINWFSMLSKRSLIVELASGLAGVVDQFATLKSVQGDAPNSRLTSPCEPLRNITQQT